MRVMHQALLALLRITDILRRVCISALQAAMELLELADYTRAEELPQLGHQPCHQDILTHVEQCPTCPQTRIASERNVGNEKR